MPEVLLLAFPVIGNAERRFAEGAQEPRPDGSLVVGAVPLRRSPPVSAAIGRVLGRKRPKPKRGEELLPNLPDDGGLFRRAERREGKRDGKNLVRPHRRIQKPLLQKIAKTGFPRVPEGFPERTAQAGQQVAVEKQGFSEFRRPVAGKAKGVVPERIDFNRGAVPRRDGDACHPGVHPGQRGPVVSGAEEPLGVHTDSEIRSLQERPDDPPHDRPETLMDQGLVRRGPQKFLNGPEIPERGVHAVVCLGCAVRGEEIGQQTVLFMPADLRQDFDPLTDAAGAEAEAGQRDQRVPSPAPEPGISGDDGRFSRWRGDEKRPGGPEEGEHMGLIFFPVSFGLSFVGVPVAAPQDDFGLPDRERVLAGDVAADREDHRAFSLERDLQDPGEKKVLLAVEAPFCLLGVLETVVPRG